MGWEMEGILPFWNLEFLIQSYNTNLCLLAKKRCNSRKAWTSHTKETNNYAIDTNWTVNPHWQTLSKHTFNYNDILVRSEMTKCKLADSWTLPTKYLSILRCLSLQTFKIFMKQFPLSYKEHGRHTFSV